MKIFIVDAFANRPFTGNPAAVAIVDEFPPDEICQNIAAEMNLSETVFVKHLDSNLFHIRWFTPKVEISLCGHATLASAHILYQEKLVGGGEEIRFKSRSGKVEEPVEVFTIGANFGKVINAALIDGNDLIVELLNEEEVRKYIPRVNELENIDSHLVILTAKGNGPYDFISRVFGPRVGVLEDPVTGSAHCELAYYWQTRLNKSNFLAYQASTRGGEIRISIVGDRVHLSGNAVTILTGELQVPLTVKK